MANRLANRYAGVDRPYHMPASSCLQIVISKEINISSIQF